MKKVHVELGERSYDIVIGAGVLLKLPHLIKEMGFTGPVVVITDKMVLAGTKHITAPLFRQLKNDVMTIAVPGTEKSKSIKVFQETVQKISGKTRTHRPMIVALGGGVVGDLAGFIAATYRRGVPLVQVPTTFLAMVDSSVGGKTGIDLPAAKNMVGAFYQPASVLMEWHFLQTLPRREVRNGLAEIIKYAIIGNESLFAYLEENMDDILRLKHAPIEKVICECVLIKAKIVEQDEHDMKDIRIALNFGHTLGHAIESAFGYGKLYSHGEAIAVGMILAGEIAMHLDMLDEKDFTRMKALIKQAGLPVRVGGISIAKIMDSYKYDKKFTTGINRFVLPRKIGSVEVIDDIPGILVRTVLRKYVR